MEIQTMAKAREGLRDWLALARQYLLYSDTPEQEQAAFDAYASGTTARLASALFVVASAAIVLWWPLDFVLYDKEPATLHAMVDFRLATLVLSLLGMSTPWIARRLNISPVPLIALCGAAVSWVATWSCGRAAPLSPAWFGISYVFPITTIGFVVSFPERVVIACLFGAAAWSGYFLGNPQHLAAEAYVGVTVSFMLVTIVSGTAIGHLSYHYLRAGFLAQRSLALMKDDLEDRVRAQTSDLRQFTGRLELLREREREEIARELVAGPGEELAAIEFEVSLLEEMSQRQGLALSFDQVRSLGDRMRGTFGRRVGNLRASTLGDGDLRDSIRQLADEQTKPSGLELALELPEEPLVLSEAIASATYRILQEALTNVVRHAQATRVELVLRQQPDGLFASVRDNGRGLADRATWRQESVGIIGMQERALGVGAVLQISPVPTGGTIVTFEIPKQRMAA